MPMPELRQKKSWPKLLGFINASLDPHVSCQKPRYGWVDTFCINKTSSAELSEAINSMFRWYRNADLCIAFLDDVSTTAFGIINALQEASEDFSKSLWFTRGWTLQELLAPSEVKFYNRQWKVIGLRNALASLISPATGIDINVVGGGSWSNTSIASRMKWAATRVTTRLEDRAYCLLGIFDINMPLLYGEGEKAFRRLQEAILMQYDDQSIFLWSPPKDISPKGGLKDISPKIRAFPLARALAPALAPDPSWFGDTPLHDLFPTDASPAILTNQGIQIRIPILPNPTSIYQPLFSTSPRSAFLGIVACCPMDDNTTHLAIPLERHSANTPVYSRLLAPPQSIALGKAVPKVDQIQLTRIPNSSAGHLGGLRSVQLVLPPGKKKGLPGIRRRKIETEGPSEKLHVKAVYPGYPPSSNQHTENSGAYRLEPLSPYVIFCLEDEFSGPEEPLFLFMTHLGGVVPWRYSANSTQPPCLREFVSGSIKLETLEHVGGFTMRFSQETNIPAWNLKPQSIFQRKTFIVGGVTYYANLTIFGLREGYVGIVNIHRYGISSTLAKIGLGMLGGWSAR